MSVCSACMTAHCACMMTYCNDIGHVVYAIWYRYIVLTWMLACCACTMTCSASMLCMVYPMNTIHVRHVHVKFHIDHPPYVLASSMAISQITSCLLALHVYIASLQGSSPAFGTCTFIEGFWWRSYVDVCCWLPIASSTLYMSVSTYIPHRYYSYC